MDSQNFHQYEQDHQILELLATLSYRSGDLGGYLHEVACGVSHLLKSDWSIVTIHEGETGQVVANSRGMSGGDEFAVYGTLAGEVIQSGQVLIIEDIRQEARRNTLPEGYICYMGVPLRTVQGGISGTICSFFQQPRQLTETEVVTVELFAERAATVIDNYRLYQQQQKFSALLEQEVATRTEELRISQAKLVERERLAAIGEFAAMIVHEIRNPLTTITMGLNYAKAMLNTASAQERLSLSLNESYRLQRLLNEILLYSKPQILQLSRVSIGKFLSELLAQMRELPEATERSLELIQPFTDTEILADSDRLKQVFINLFRNACEAIATGEVVTCEIATCENPAQVCIRIHNRGEPIPPEILLKLTEPFCSTKASGTGLGLAIVKQIVTAHNGDLSIQSDAIIGTVVSVRLPITDF